MGFKERLKDAIDYKGLSIKEIASQAGISSNTLLSYIDARGYLPNVETAVKIATILDVSVEYLVTGKSSVVINEETDSLFQTFSHLNKHDKHLLIKIANSMDEISESI